MRVSECTLSNTWKGILLCARSAPTQGHNHFGNVAPTSGDSRDGGEIGACSKVGTSERARFYITVGVSG